MELSISSTPKSTKQPARGKKREDYTPSPTSVLQPLHKFQEREERKSVGIHERLLLEYKHIKENTPRGIYVIPSLHQHEIFYGVIFIRRALFKNGIFKFKILVPQDYGNLQSRPSVVFISDIFHPYIDPKTKSLDMEIGFPTWDPKKHALLSVVMFIKKMFFTSGFIQPKNGNYNAWLLSSIDPVGFQSKVYQCVDDSQRCIHDEPKSTVKFAPVDEIKYHVFRNLMKTASSDTLEINEILDMVLDSTPNRQCFF